MTLIQIKYDRVHSFAQDIEIRRTRDLLKYNVGNQIAFKRTRNTILIGLTVCCVCVCVCQAAGTKLISKIAWHACNSLGRISSRKKWPSKSAFRNSSNSITKNSHWKKTHTHKYDVHPARLNRTSEIIKRCQCCLMFSLKRLKL